MTNEDKFCPKCGETKKTGDFSKKRDRKDGLQQHCKSCVNAYNREYYKKNSESIKANVKKWYYDNHEYVLQYWKEHRVKNWDKILERKREYDKRNRNRATHKSRRRQLAKEQAIPVWADTAKIKEIYLNKPKGYVVDHIIPIRGENVCGLHVHENLQYMGLSENAKKSNYLPRECEIGWFLNNPFRNNDPRKMLS